MTHLIKQPKDNPEPPMSELLRLMQEVHAQNVKLLERLDTMERNSGKRAAVWGFGGGLAGGSLISVGFELIKAKFGG